MNDDEERLWRDAVNRLFDELNKLENKVLQLEAELELVRTKPRHDQAGEEYWEHG
jgi:hypothetical protein